MERIVIIGCGGAGKSTLARQLGKKLNIPVVHLDKLWWKPGWVESSREEFDAKLAEELAKPQWIMDGNFNRTINQRVDRCDTLIYLDFNRVACLMGVLKRVLTTYGKVRPDMGEGCPESMITARSELTSTLNGSRSSLHKVLGTVLSASK